MKSLTSLFLFFLGLFLGLSFSADVFANLDCRTTFDELRFMDAKEREGLIAQIKKVGRQFGKTLSLAEANESSSGSAIPEILRLFRREKPGQNTQITLAQLKAYDPASIEIARTTLVDTYTAMSRANRVAPNLEQLAKKLNVKTEVLDELISEGNLFKSLKEVFVEALKRRPDAFNNVLDPRIYNEHRLGLLQKSLLTKTRHLLVTAAINTSVEMDWFKSLLVYAKKMDADIIVAPAQMQTVGLDPILLETPGVHFLTNDIHLHPNLTLSSIKIMLSQINTLAGMNRIGDRLASYVFGGAKLQLETVPTLDNKFEEPRFLLSTGALTRGDFSIRHEVQDRQRAIATEEHQLAALLIEKDFVKPTDNQVVFNGQKGFYHFRHVRFSPGKKGFFEGNKFYGSDGEIKKVRAHYVNLGDIHDGVSDPFFLEHLPQIIRYFNARAYRFHDLFDGRSINEHEKGRLVSAGHKFKAGELDLEAELRGNVLFLNAFQAYSGDAQLVIVRESNHVEWIERWLNKYLSSDSPQNRMIANEMIAAMDRGEDPYLYMLIKLGLKNPHKVTFDVDVTSKSNGVNQGAHGDKGPGGSRGSELGHKRGSNGISHGHTHVAYINGDNYSVGTSTMFLPYAKGPIAWSISFEVGFDSPEDMELIKSPTSRMLANPNRQLYVFRHSSFRAPDTTTPEMKAQLQTRFNFSEYPYIVPRTPNSIGNLMTQHSHYMKTEK